VTPQRRVKTDPRWSSDALGGLGEDCLDLVVGER
jgi:hypothetical protein